MSERHPLNPFERYGLDPSEGAAAITQRLRELAEDAAFEGDESERDAIREAWEALTRHPRERARFALLAHPQPRHPAPVARAAAAGHGSANATETPAPSPQDLFSPPSAEAAFWAACELPAPRPSLEQALAPSLAHDTALAPRHTRRALSNATDKHDP